MKIVFYASMLVSIGILLVTTFLIVNELPGRFKLVFLDVGQGDAIFIQTPSRYQILIDTGATSAVTSELGAVMRPWDRSLDLVIITHPDSDHFDALPDILDQYAVDMIIDNGFYHDPLFVEYQEMISSHEVTRVVPPSSGVFSPETDTHLTFLSVPTFGTHDDKNEDSIILRVDYRDASFLLTGDASVSIEQDLVFSDPGQLDVDVLKLGHHGSKTSTGGLFLEATTPEIVIASAGADNRYGHPHEEVLETLEDFSIPLLCTCEEGRIAFIYKDGSLRVR